MNIYFLRDNQEYMGYGTTLKDAVANLEANGGSCSDDVIGVCGEEMELGHALIPVVLLPTKPTTRGKK